MSSLFRQVSGLLIGAEMFAPIWLILNKHIKPGMAMERIPGTQGWGLMSQQE